MPCHLKSIALSLTLLALVFLTIGISVPFFIKNYSIWDLDDIIHTSGYCKPSKFPETENGQQCVFPFISAFSTKYDCTVTLSGNYLWCATACLSTGHMTTYAKCKSTRASTLEGIYDIQKIGIQDIDLARTIRACLLIAVLILVAVSIMNVVEFYVDVCAGNEPLEIATAVLGLLAVVLILIGLAIPITKISFVSEIGWAFWLILTSVVVAIAAVACYIVGLQGDRVARRIYPFKMTEPIDEADIKVPSFHPTASVNRYPHHNNLVPNYNERYPGRWVRMEPPVTLRG